MGNPTKQHRRTTTPPQKPGAALSRAARRGARGASNSVRQDQLRAVGPGQVETYPEMGWGAGLGLEQEEERDTAVREAPHFDPVDGLVVDLEPLDKVPLGPVSLGGVVVSGDAAISGRLRAKTADGLGITYNPLSGAGAVSASAAIEGVTGKLGVGLSAGGPQLQVGTKALGTTQVVSVQPSLNGMTVRYRNEAPIAEVVGDHTISGNLSMTATLHFEREGSGPGTGLDPQTIQEMEKARDRLLVGLGVTGTLLLLEEVAPYLLLLLL